jgi:hypothetical protein
LTGFVLEPLFPTPAILMGLGSALELAGLLLSWRLSPSRRVLILLPVVLSGAGVTIGVDSPCDVETAYYCARIDVDPAEPSGRLLVLNRFDNSYVDVKDPTELRFGYIRTFAAVIDATLIGPIDTVHVGGGGLTMPRWLAATRPGSHGVVLELDPALVELAIARLGWRPTPDVEIVTGDARVSMRRLPAASADVVIGDAFAGIAVPWHLTTVECIRRIGALLRPGGLYVVNVIDGTGLAFVRAEAATLSEVFPHVAVISVAGRLEWGGNFVLVGSGSQIPVSEIERRGDGLDLELRVITGPELASFLGDARPLTDDHAPVDQLLTRQAGQPSQLPTGYTSRFARQGL